MCYVAVMASTIVFNGQKFFFNGRDYFRNARGQLLHRVMWEHFNGPIPKGHIVHHINEDKTDNRVENLVLMERAEHMRHHGLRGFAVASPEWRIQHAKDVWGKRQPVQRTCGLCGGIYETRSTYSSWCSVKCRVAARYRGLTGPSNHTKG